MKKEFYKGFITCLMLLLMVGMAYAIIEDNMENKQILLNALEEVDDNGEIYYSEKIEITNNLLYTLKEMPFQRCMQMCVENNYGGNI